MRESMPNDGKYSKKVAPRRMMARGENRAQPIENGRHRFARENKAGKENARQDKSHRHLERLHLVFGLGRNEQAEAEEREDVNNVARTIATMLPAIGTKKTKCMIPKRRKAISIPMQR